MNFTYPLQIDRTGRIATCSYESHVAHLIRQLLFTSPGERVHRLTFGCGLRRLVFEPGGDVLAVAVQSLVLAALQQWLGDVIVVESLEIRAIDSQLEVELAYVLKRTGEQVTGVFTG